MKKLAQPSENKDHGIQSHHFNANRLGNSGRLYFSGLQNHCRWWLNHEIKKTLTLWKKSYDQPRQHIKKQRHYFANKGPSSQDYGFSSSLVWMWVLKKAECWRIDAFELWYWRRLLRVPWTARRSNQSILKEISPGCSLEGMMLKLKLQYFGHLMWEVNSLEKTLMLGGIGDRRRRGQQRMRCWIASLTRWTWVWVNSGSWWWTRRPGVLQFMGSQRVGHDWATELNWAGPWCWEGLRAGGLGDDRGWDGWMALLNQWTWVWVNSGI